MIQWPRYVPIYLHRDPVDSRKAINGLAVIVSDVMAEALGKRMFQMAT
ncbi:hypothetical protein [Marinomonas algarum]|uniref:Uncharacterized protein n=1 Tax=Marinomonas algarum TaxID=2883105 RepID=A0A9X1LFJ3_9GAMM|nr:hypothetical protein [Marinomonas algarum]MCB5163020.1 hypothetical protein [Marinomonas algarum]